jgi:HEPN domain-containing protein
MRPSTHEWIVKAEGDYVMACREIRARKAPNYDGVCFHAQPCVEKYLKARLHADGVDFPKTHDLALLLDLTMPSEPDWELLRPAAETLTDYAVRVRYPGISADKQTAQEALSCCSLIRERARLSLNLPDEKKTGRAGQCTLPRAKPKRRTRK